MKISIVVSIYNEEDMIEIFWEELKKHLRYTNLEYEFVL